MNTRKAKNREWRAAKRGEGREIANWSFQIANCKLNKELPDRMQARDSRPSPLAPHPLRHSPRPSRRGVSLLEVLISIGVLAIGLLSILMIIPLGQMTIAESVKADRAGACGRAVMRDIKVKRMLDFRSWWCGYITPTNNTVDELWGWAWYDSPVIVGGIPQIKRKWIPIADPYTPFVDPDDPTNTRIIQLTDLSEATGSFIIDPLGVSKGLSNIFYLPRGFEIGKAISPQFFTSPPPPTPLPILPRRSLSPTYLNNPDVLPRSPINGTAFNWPDDLALDMPENTVDRPFINSAYGLDNSRSLDYSYLLTVSPSIAEQRLPFPNRRMFDVTVVVFFKRNFDTTLDANSNLAGFPEGEWMADVRGISGLSAGAISPGGGTIALGAPWWQASGAPWTNRYAYRVKGTATQGQLPGNAVNYANSSVLDISNKLPFVREGQWIMLWDSASGRSAWYRVIGVNFPEILNTNNPPTLTLDGPDWIVSPDHETPGHRRRNRSLHFHRGIGLRSAVARNEMKKGAGG